MVISPSPPAGEGRVSGCYARLDPSDEAIARAHRTGSQSGPACCAEPTQSGTFAQHIRNSLIEDSTRDAILGGRSIVSPRFEPTCEADGWAPCDSNSHSDSRVVSAVKLIDWVASWSSMYLTLTPGRS